MTYTLEIIFSLAVFALAALASLVALESFGALVALESAGALVATPNLFVGALVGVPMVPNLLVGAFVGAVVGFDVVGFVVVGFIVVGLDVVGFVVVRLDVVGFVVVGLDVVRFVVVGLDVVGFVVVGDLLKLADGLAVGVCWDYPDDSTVLPISRYRRSKASLLLLSTGVTAHLR